MSSQRYIVAYAADGLAYTGRIRGVDVWLAITSLGICVITAKVDGNRSSDEDISLGVCSRRSYRFILSL
jgi:hypothetical protein